MWQGKIDVNYGEVHKRRQFFKNQQERSVKNWDVEKLTQTNSAFVEVALKNLVMGKLTRNMVRNWQRVGMLRQIYQGVVKLMQEWTIKCVRD